MACSIILTGRPLRSSSRLPFCLVLRFVTTSISYVSGHASSRVGSIDSLSLNIISASLNIIWNWPSRSTFSVDLPNRFCFAIPSCSIRRSSFWFISVSCRSCDSAIFWIERYIAIMSFLVNFASWFSVSFFSIILDYHKKLWLYIKIQELSKSVENLENSCIWRWQLLTDIYF